MNKIMKISSALLLSVFMMAGCSSKEAAPAAGEMSAVDAKYAGATHVGNVTSKQLHHAIMAAGKAQGWRMTEFKNNEVIAEKFGDDAVTASIKFSKHGYEIHSESENGLISDLTAAIKEQLSADESH